MFQQRLQALMLQDIKAARRMWREFADGEDAHVLTVEQFHQVPLAALRWQPIHVFTGDATYWCPLFLCGMSRGSCCPEPLLMH